MPALIFFMDEQNYRKKDSCVTRVGEPYVSMSTFSVFMHIVVRQTLYWWIIV